MHSYAEQNYRLTDINLRQQFVDKTRNWFKATLESGALGPDRDVIEFLPLAMGPDDMKSPNNIQYTTQILKLFSDVITFLKTSGASDLQL